MPPYNTFTASAAFNRSKYPGCNIFRQFTHKTVKKNANSVKYTVVAQSLQKCAMLNMIGIDPETSSG